MASWVSWGRSLKGGMDGEVVVLLQGLQHLLVPQGIARGPGPHRALPEAQIGVGDHQVGVDDAGGCPGRSRPGRRLAGY